MGGQVQNKRPSRSDLPIRPTPPSQSTTLRRLADRFDQFMSIDSPYQLLARKFECRETQLCRLIVDIFRSDAIPGALGFRATDLPEKEQDIPSFVLNKMVPQIHSVYPGGLRAGFGTTINPHDWRLQSPPNGQGTQTPIGDHQFSLRAEEIDAAGIFDLRTQAEDCADLARFLADLIDESNVSHNTGAAGSTPIKPPSDPSTAIVILMNLQKAGKSRPTGQEMAVHLGIDRSTFFRWKNENRPLEIAWNAFYSINDAPRLSGKRRRQGGQMNHIPRKYTCLDQSDGDDQEDNFLHGYDEV